jgi:hypothetical protein
MLAASRTSTFVSVSDLLVSGFDQTTAGIHSYHVCMGNLGALCVRQEGLC